MTTSAPGWAAHLPAALPEVDVLARESLPRAWVANWASAPRSVALRSPGGEVVTAEELEQRTRAVASRYSAAGLQPGDRIVVSASASIPLVVAYVAAHRLGLVVVPMNTAYRAAEIAHIVRNTTPRAAVVDDPSVAAAVGDSATEPIAIFGVDVDAPAGPEPKLDLSTRDAPALICHTSGTTGLPKGAVLTSGNLLASAEAVRIAWRWTAEDRLALMLPLFHLHGLGVGVHGSLVSGAEAIVFDGFSPDAVADAAVDLQASMFFGVPTMYHRLLQHDRVAELKRLRLCVSGSAPLPAEFHNRFAELTGQRIIERYGMTETVMLVSNPFDGPRKPGSVGIPLPGVEVRLANGEGPGEIQVRGPNVFGGYWNQAEATAASFTDDGWFLTGDIGQWDDDGYLSIVGRSKELIISGGYNVYPREVEDLLLTHPGVAEAAVVGWPSQEWGETVVAFVVPAGSVGPDEVKDYAAERLAAYKRPRQVHVVDRLPRNALGKILRDDLVQRSPSDGAGR